jgi:hypothetical protein
MRISFGFLYGVGGRRKKFNFFHPLPPYENPNEILMYGYATADRSCGISQLLLGKVYPPNVGLSKWKQRVKTWFTPLIWASHGERVKRGVIWFQLVPNFNLFPSFTGFFILTAYLRKFSQNWSITISDFWTIATFRGTPIAGVFGQSDRSQNKGRLAPGHSSIWYTW